MCNLDRATFVMLAFFYKVGVVRLLCGIKITDAMLSPVVFNTRLESATLSVSAQDYAKKAGFIVPRRLPQILTVDGICYFAKVVKTIVSSVAVNMVNCMHRPISGHVQERQTMRETFGIVNHDAHITGAVEVSSNVTSIGAFTLNAPCKNASIWVVVEQLANALCCKIINGHPTSEQVVWLEPGHRLCGVSARSF